MGKFIAPFRKLRWWLMLLFALSLVNTGTLQPATAQPANPGLAGQPSPSPLTPTARQLITLLQRHGIHSVWHPHTGVPTFLAAPPNQVIPLSPAGQPDHTPAAQARRFLAAYSPLFGIAQPATAFQLISSQTDAHGLTHVRFRQQAHGWPVFGAQLIIHLTANGQVYAVNGKVAPHVRIPAKPELTLQQAYTLAIRDLAIKPEGDPNEQPFSAGNLLSHALVVFNPALLDQGPNANSLAYWLRIDDPTTPAIWSILVDAQEGQILLRYNELPTQKARSIHDLDGGTVLPGPPCYDENGPIGLPSADCQKAFQYTGDVYDYLMTHFQRDSYDNAGAPMIASVRIGNWQNASWNGTQTKFGSGWAVKDIVAHEWIHALTQYSAGLIYYAQSGALNEAFSDAFAALIDDDDWLVGEDLAIGPVRSLQDPSAHGDPGRLSEFNCTLGDNGGVHINSGIFNHAVYLMAEGGIYNGFVIEGIGRPATGSILYQALTQYLIPTSNFSDAYFALQNACYDLFGNASNTCLAVQLALDAVELHTPVPPCTASSPAPPDFAQAIRKTALTWYAQDPNTDSLTYDVLLEAGDETPDRMVCQEVTVPHCDPGILEPGTTYYWQVIARDGTFLTPGPVWQFTTATEEVASFPFYDGFELGTLGPGWSVVSEGQGTVTVNGYAPQAGHHAALLYDLLPDTIASTAGLILSIDLAGQTQVDLDFWWREFNDENHPADGIFVSADAGMTWQQIFSFNDGPSTYRHEIIDLDAAIVQSGLEFNEHFQIKFQFYDDWPIPTDGYALDEVRVIAAPETTIESTCPDLFKSDGVDTKDIQAVASRWHTPIDPASGPVAYDLNRDGVINVIDIALVAAAWGQPCP